MQANAASAEERPYVETTVARILRSRLQLAHDEKGIVVISGPWGIGKTTAISAFAAENECGCVVVKVEQSTKRGASAADVMRYVLEAMRPMLHKSERATLSNAYWALRQLIWRYLAELVDEEDLKAGYHPPFTLIFDEAQYLSREAIEMLRYWNDQDRTVTPFPVGLVFIGNNEFALKEDASGQSVISGAVRSRALFVEELDYLDITDADLVLFAQSRGITDAGAIATIIDYFSSARVKRDLRNIDKLIPAFRRRAAGKAITAETVRSVLVPA